MLSELDDELHVFILSFCTGEQCSSYETLDTAAGKCQQLIIDNAAAARSFKLECLKQFHFCRRSWCQHLTSCLSETSKWKYSCRWKFLWFTDFNITSVVSGINSSSVRFYVKLCYKNYHRRNYTITLTEHESGSANAKNGLYGSFYTTLKPQFNLVQDTTYTPNVGVLSLDKDHVTWYQNNQYTQNIYTRVSFITVTSKNFAVANATYSVRAILFKII